MKRIFYIAILLLTATSFACGGTQKTEQDAKMHSPPQDDEVKMPTGGPSVDPSDVKPRETREPVVAEISPTGQEPEVTRTQVSSFMRRGPAYLLTRIEVEPVHTDSGFGGFKLVKASDGVSTFMQPQMQLGDVVTHINGIRVERPDDYLQAWNALAKTEWIRVDFKRGEEKLHAVWAVKDE